jgi:hypothetical protein
MDGLVRTRIKQPFLIAELNAQLVLVWNILRIVRLTPVHATQNALMIIITMITMHIALLHKVRFKSKRRSLLRRNDN